MSREEFCPGSMRWLSRRWRGTSGGGCRDRMQALAHRRWLAVELSGAHPAGASDLAVVLTGGRRIEVGRGFDAKTLEQLVGLLEPA